MNVQARQNHDLQPINPEMSVILVHLLQDRESPPEAN